MRYLLFPFSLIYGGIVWVRNLLFDVGVFKSTSYNFPVIAIGNLSVGGTGKTPMTVYLLNFLKSYKTVGILSRGYKRKSKGFVLATETITVEELGDEPFQIYHNSPESVVAVDADRRNGIAQLEHLDKLPEVLVLDDAYQHRKVKAGMYMLLTTYNSLYVDDVMLPAGHLRDTKNQASRASIVVVTKCPDGITDADMKGVERTLQLQAHQSVYFTTINYSNKVFAEQNFKELSSLQDVPFTLVTGIAKPEYLVQFLQNEGLAFEHLKYPDHHNFTEAELTTIRSKELIITTEKDYVRLMGKVDNLYYLPIETVFLKDEESFKKQVLQFIEA